MKKFNFFVIVLLITILQIGCNSDMKSKTIKSSNIENDIAANSNNQNSDSINTDHDNSKESKILDKIQFNADFSLISLNTNTDSETNHSLYFYGTISNEDNEDIETLKQKLYKEVQSITVMKSDGIFVQSDDLDWVLKENNSVITFTLTICNVQTDVTGEIKLLKLKLNNNANYVEKKLSNYYIYAYSEIENHVTIAESPIAPKNLPSMNTNSMLAYKVMTINHEFNKDFKADIKVPNALKDYIIIDNITWEIDEDFMNEVKKSFKNELTLTQAKDLKIYSVFVTYRINTTKNIIFQPNISINIANINQTIAPLTPLVLIYK